MRVFSFTLLLAALCSFVAAVTSAGPGDFNFLHPEFAFEASPLPEIAGDGQFPFRGPSECEVALLSTGEVSLAARLQTIKNAKKSILIQSLIFTGDEVGRHITELLIQKKKEGLDVRVIVDAVSNAGWQTQAMYYDLKQHGIEVEGYEPLYLHWINEISLRDPLRFNKRYHDKIWLVDGEIAIIGGRNIANEYYETGPKIKAKWRDQDVALRGRIVEDIGNAFERNYQYLKDIKKSRFIFNTDHYWKVWRGFLDVVGKFKVRYSRKTKHVTKYIKDIEVKCDEVKLDFLPAMGRFMHSRPRFEETYIEQAYLDAINSAREEIIIANAYFIPSEDLVFAIQQAARRGVKVTILTNSRETNDIQFLAYASRYHYHGLLMINYDHDTQAARGKVEIAEWDGPRYGMGTLHAKFMVVDRLVAVVGSYNLDPRSAKHNSETNVGFMNERLATELAEHVTGFDLPRSKVVSFSEATDYRYPQKFHDRLMLYLALKVKHLL